MPFKRYILVVAVLFILITDSDCALVKREVLDFATFFQSRTNELPKASIVKVPCRQGHREIGGQCRKVYYR